MARGMGVNLVALKAATMLCRLELRDGSARESGQTLAELYDWFTEGLETADLLDARAVLDEWKKKNSLQND